ncbi:hypothetical protein PR048_000578 [Dryococelus australis]|uniref:Uncharacterized protein n=1 Tax=Dryococelus australis TaxID=614101 RepID=A0ABQ9IHD7_9NEOP|nr:hypothetical protein PR048_000578 [Dryococelus australis]
MTNIAIQLHINIIQIIKKLWKFNFTSYDSYDGSVHCVMWDESKAGRGGNEIASGILKWADHVIPNSTVDEITVWTVNCYGQNKSMSVIMCFFWILHKYSQAIRTWKQTQSMHRLKERKKSSNIKNINTIRLATAGVPNV